jgi:multidrug efflux pump subunit AcrA (membrane-fusion protein)
MTTNRKTRLVWAAALAGGFLIAVVALLLLWPHDTAAGDRDAAAAAYDDEPEPREVVPMVQTVRPARNQSFMIEVQQPADVIPFYRADLSALVAGYVKRMPKGLGDQVKKGELLIDIDVPDRVQEVAEKAAVVRQRTREQELAEHRADIAREAVKVAEQNIKQRQSEVIVADAEKEWRRLELGRYRRLAGKEAITRDFVDEKIKFYRAAQAGAVTARVAVQKANADLEEAKAKLKAALADIKLKASLVEVALQDLARAEALAQYAQLRASWDGMVIRREVDPGDFVQNAASGHPQPLLSLVRTDIMTVVMKLPDYYAPYVNLDTDAIIQLPPDRLIRAKVTRFSPSIQEKDRTMRVEVDLFNRRLTDYHKFILNGVSAFLPGMTTGGAAEKAVLLAAGRSVWGDNMKGSLDPFPGFPREPTGDPEHPPRLLPRMYGHMTLLLKNSQNDYLIPRSAVFSVGGKPHILVVKHGKAERVPVSLDLKDNRLAKVTILVHKTLEDGEIDERQNLTGREEIVLKGQNEIRDGQAVRTRRTAWPSWAGTTARK